MRKFLFAVLFFSPLISVAQDNKDELIGNTKNVQSKEIKEGDDGWKKGGVFNLTLSQVSLSNWAAGGLNSLSLNGLSGLYANYKKGKSTWDNNLDLGYGVIRQYSQGNFNKSLWIKSDDKIDFSSKYGRQAFDKWFYSGLLNFKTQFAPGYQDQSLPDSLRVTISKFLAPAYGIAALGMDYKLNATFSLFMAPITGKFTIVNDPLLSAAGAFGVAKNEKFRAELGAYVRMMYAKDVMKNIKFTSRLELFNNYLVNFGNVDINWETLTSMKVNEIITVTFATHLIYDDDIKIAVDRTGDGVIDGSGPRVQFKTVFGAGLTYKF